MNTDEINEELAVMQLSDSFFPTGLYATSNGLEFLFSNNEIKGLEDIKNMIKVNIEQQIGPSDCIALSHAFTNAVKDDNMLNEYQKAIKEKRVHGIFPVAFAICCNALNIREEKSLTMLLYGFTVSVIGAALRLGLIQHLEGQKIIHEIKPIIIQTLKENSNKSLFDMWQFAPQFDIIQMSHEKMDSKMFIT